MIVHLFDDEKFVDATINNFEKIAEGVNRYIVFSNSKTLKHPKRTDKIEILTNKWYKLKVNDIFKDCDLLVIHYLTPLKASILKKVPKDITVLWIIWGGDAYSLIKEFKVFENKTEEAAQNFKEKKFKENYLYNIYHLIKYGISPVTRHKNYFNKINYISTVLPPEFNFIQPYFNKKAKYLKFSYDALKDLLNNPNLPTLGKGVLLGNSATLENNHLDALHLIKEMEVTKLLVPLNYGDMQYQKFVLNVGTDLFGSTFEAITEFLEFNNYKLQIFSCNSMVMHHIRQQALGNILLALLSGIRVFLNKNSITYDYMRSLGFLVFNLEDDIETLEIELTTADKLINQKLVIANWGQLKIKEGITNVVSLYNTIIEPKRTNFHSKNKN